MAFIADYLENVKPSAISVVTALAMDLARQGRDIIRLSAGEPDFDTPDHIKQACVEALNQGKTKYPPVVGVYELREAICRKLKKDNDLDYQIDQVTVSAGAKQVLFNAFAATINPGDEVILPCPYWMSYPNMVRFNQGVPVAVPTTVESGFKMTAEALASKITPKTKWLVLNSPGNPSGSVYSEGELQAIADVLRRHPQVHILSDDIYEYMVYEDTRFVSIGQVAPDLLPRLLIVNGFSKAYAMTGWRLGYGAGPLELIKTMFKIQSQSTSGANTMAQWAGVTALEGDHGFVAKNNELFQKRRDLVVSKINKIKGLYCDKPAGAFYCYISCLGLIGKKTPMGDVIASDADFVKYLLNETGVAVVHGEPFGLSPFFRISFATSEQILEKACERITQACELLQ